MPGTKKAATIKVPSEDQDKKDGEGKRREQSHDLSSEVPPAKHNPEDEESELSQEDRELKERLELLVERVTETKTEEGLRRQALEALKKEIRSSTASMTSVPKPLKFLRPHYDTLKTFYTALKASSQNKKFLADVLSVLAMTMAAEGTRESLTFKLCGTNEDLGSWGHEYVRHLAGEIGEQYQQRMEAKEATDDLMALVREIVPFNIKHNAESDACDLLLEVDHLSEIKAVCNKDNHSRVCYYLVGCADYLPDQEDKDRVLRIVYDIYVAADALTDALRVAIKLNDRDLMLQLFAAAEQSNRTVLRKQLALLLGQAKIVLEEFEDDDDLYEIMGNTQLSTQFKSLARELDVQEAKTPEDIYKSHLVDGSNPLKRRQGGERKVDSAKQNLATTFVNAFVNMGFGNDSLVTPEGSDWLYKNKDHGMLSAAASLGMILQWDVETGFSSIDKYSFSAQNHIKAGALLGTGLISSGVTSDMDAALGLLAEHLEGDNVTMKIGAILGLGFAYAGTAREDLLETLVPLLVDESQPFEVMALTALAIGFVFVGSSNDEVATTIFEVFTESTETQLNDSVARFLCLGMGLLYIGKGEACELMLEVVSAIDHPIKDYLHITVKSCAYFGTGSVLEVQKLLAICGQHPPATEEKEGKDTSGAGAGDGDDSKEAKEEDEVKTMHQAASVLGLAAVTLGESLGADMALRALDHVLQYGEVCVRRAIPLALGLLSVSNPRMAVMDTLSKLSHDQDERVSQNAVIALGFIGAGTNNSRIANLLRQLSVYYAKEPNHLFLVRIAQGLLHMGKGLMTLSPMYSDSMLISPTAAAGLLTVMHAMLDGKKTILANRHYLLFSLATAARPRMLMTVDENLEPVPVKVRVGQAVDTVGQAGKPKTITGFQTHTTPVLLSVNERAELATDEFIPYTNVLEGFVIVRPNPDAAPESK